MLWLHVRHGAPSHQCVPRVSSLHQEALGLERDLSRWLSLLTLLLSAPSTSETARCACASRPRTASGVPVRSAPLSSLSLAPDLVREAAEALLEPSSLG